MINSPAAAEEAEMLEQAGTRLSQQEPARELEPTLAVMRSVLQKRFGIVDANLALDRPLDSLGLDSLAFIEYCFEIEGELGVTLPDVPRDLGSIGDLARFIHAEYSRKQDPANPA